MRRSHQPPQQVFQPPSQMNWTDEKLAGLNKEQLLNLYGNLKIQRESGRVTEEAADDLTRRISERLPANALTVKPKRLRSAVLFEESVAQKLGGLAASLHRRYDLTVETALQLSAGTKGFKPLTLTDKRGEPKTGGSIKSGRMAIDRYISYRVRDSLASLAFLLPPDQPKESGRFVVLATEDLLEGDAELNDLVPLAKEHGWSESFRVRMRAKAAADFAEAEKLYEELIERVATKLPPE